MILRNLSLHNIRSYNEDEETRLDFPEGVTLFEGDIGTGKSTLLYALEFALFGLSDMKGGHLLSEGRKEGRVSLTFESGGKEYNVERRLRVKGDEVIQGECRIWAGGESERMSPTDLKERIVSILGFNEPTHPRAESLVYRYAIFTPQELMKDILTQNAEERLHVIRRVLGAQNYQVAAENSEIVGRRIKEVGHGLRKASEDLEEKKEEAEEKSKTIAEHESEVPRLREAESAASRTVRNLESEWKETMEERRSLTKSEAKLPLLKEERSGLRASIDEDDQRIRDLESRLAKEIQPKIDAFERLKSGGSVRELEEESDRTKEKLGRLKESRRNLEAELSSSRDLIAKGVCPLCGQRIPGELAVRNEHREKELAKLDEETTTSESLAVSLAVRVEEARGYEEAKKEKERAEKDRTRVDKDIESLRKRTHESTARISQLTADLERAESQLKTMLEVSARIADLDSKLVDARQREKQATQDLTQVTTELRDAVRELRLLSEELKKKESKRREAQRLTSYQGWLSDFFGPSVRLIEEQMLAFAASRFTEHFQRFFNSLVDDPDMVVRVKENFSPLFEREGFEQDYEALSGGERTSMALAYRFALNAVVGETLSTAPELVILDEPTDGFSKEQVYKMRGLLDALGSRQVILVSHERELESMADHIFRVEKRNGSSVVLDSGKS